MASRQEACSCQSVLYLPLSRAGNPTLRQPCPDHRRANQVRRRWSPHHSPLLAGEGPGVRSAPPPPAPGAGGGGGAGPPPPPPSPLPPPPAGGGGGFLWEFVPKSVAAL